MRNPPIITTQDCTLALTLLTENRVCDENESWLQAVCEHNSDPELLTAFAHSDWCSLVHSAAVNITTPEAALHYITTHPMLGRWQEYNERPMLAHLARNKSISLMTLNTLLESPHFWVRRIARHQLYMRQGITRGDNVQLRLF